MPTAIKALRPGIQGIDMTNMLDPALDFSDQSCIVSSILTVKQETNSHRMTELEGSVSTGNGRSFSRKPSFREVIASF